MFLAATHFRSARATVAIALVVWILAGAVIIDRATLVPRFEGGLDSIGGVRQYPGRWTLAGEFFAERAAPDATVAITAAGVIPYYSRLRTLDIQGINDAWIAHEVAPTSTRAGHTREAPDAYLIEREVDYLVYHPNIASEPPDPVRPHWGQRGYRWVVVRLPSVEPLWFGFWEREDRSHSVLGS